jgi:Polyketide cyclase / dehydrase and lipid transport
MGATARRAGRGFPLHGLRVLGVFRRGRYGQSVHVRGARLANATIHESTATIEAPCKVREDCVNAAVVENEVEIRRSPEEVFDYTTDLTREHEWNPKTRRVDKLTEGQIGAGTRFEATFLKGDPMTIEVVRLERPRRVGIGRAIPPYRSHHAGHCHRDARWRSADHADGVASTPRAEGAAAAACPLHASAAGAQSDRDQGAARRLSIS